MKFAEVTQDVVIARPQAIRFVQTVNSYSVQFTLGLLHQYLDQHNITSKLFA